MGHRQCSVLIGGSGLYVETLFSFGPVFQQITGHRSNRRSSASSTAGWTVGSGVVPLSVEKVMWPGSSGIAPKGCNVIPRNRRLVLASRAWISRAILAVERLIQVATGTSRQIEPHCFSRSYDATRAGGSGVSTMTTACDGHSAGPAAWSNPVPRSTIVSSACSSSQACEMPGRLPRPSARRTTGRPESALLRAEPRKRRRPPTGAASTRRTRARRLAANASCHARVVVPLPPFPLARSTVCPAQGGAALEERTSRRRSAA